MTERAPVIEQVNVNGGRFIREGKVNTINYYDKSIIRGLKIVVLNYLNVSIVCMCC